MRRVLVRVGTGVALFYGTLAAAAFVLRWRIKSEGDETSDELALAAVARGAELRSRATALRGGSARAIMGGLQLDLRGATLDPAGARLELSAVFGGIQVNVPPDWNVEVVRSRSLLGGVAHPPPTDIGAGPAPLLELYCRAVLGGIDIQLKSQVQDAA
jgi:hypothetical protein